LNPEHEWLEPQIAAQKTKEEIAYHSGKEFFRLDRAGSAHDARKAN